MNYGCHLLLLHSVSSLYIIEFAAFEGDGMSLLHKHTSYGKVGSICVDFEHLFEVWQD